jgi:hypothetical protein
MLEQRLSPTRWTRGSLSLEGGEAGLEELDVGKGGGDMSGGRNVAEGGSGSSRVKGLEGSPGGRGEESDGIGGGKETNGSTKASFGNLRLDSISKRH